jgi:hypothetical protein
MIYSLLARRKIPLATPTPQKRKKERKKEFYQCHDIWSKILFKLVSFNTQWLKHVENLLKHILMSENYTTVIIYVLQAFTYFIIWTHVM